MKITGFLGPTYPSRSTNFQSDRTINFYPEANPSPDPNVKSMLALIGTPGLLVFQTVGVGPIRPGGMHVLNGVIYVVSQNKLYSLLADKTVSASLGQLDTSSGPVTIKDNGLAASGIGGDQVAIEDGEHVYIYNISTTAWTKITSFVPRGLTYIDGYFICPVANAMTFQVSNLYDGTTWGGLAVAHAVSTSDVLKACCNSKQELWLVKEYSSEIWYNTGTATSAGCPFSRIPGAVLGFGTSAPGSIVVGYDTVFMLANMRQGDFGQTVGVVMCQAYAPTVISPPAINYQISHMSTVTDAYAFMYSAEGHTFYVITFPTGDRTFAYDLTTGMWHERSSFSSLGTIYDVFKWRVSAYASLDNIMYVGDYGSNIVYTMGSDYFTDAGDPIVSRRIAPHLFDPQDLDNVFIYRMQIDIEFGTVGVTGLVISKYGANVYTYGDKIPVYGSSTTSTPIAELSFSGDGGKTFGTRWPATMGQTGGSKKELMWRRLGYTRNGVAQLAMYYPVKRIILGGYAEVSK